MIFIMHTGTQKHGSVLTEEGGKRMIDRTKVIKGLKYCKEYFSCCDKCPYWHSGTQCVSDLANDAFDLLKEHTGETHDGVWNTAISRTLDPIVTHWMPLPEPPENGVQRDE